MNTREILETRLFEAEEALHLLQLGKKEYTVNISGFGNVAFTQADVKQLEGYITNLKQRIARLNGSMKRTTIYPKF